MNIYYSESFVFVVFIACKTLKCDEWVNENGGIFIKK